MTVMRYREVPSWFMQKNSVYYKIRWRWKRFRCRSTTGSILNLAAFSTNIY